MTVTLAADASRDTANSPRTFAYGRQTLIQADCRTWLRNAPPDSISAVVTDPPYGLVEYRPDQQQKLREGRGGIWRIPPSFDGSVRRPLPRFTVLSGSDRRAVAAFFSEWAFELIRVVKPGAHVFVAGNPLLSPLVSLAMEASGFERRGEIVRLVRTFRGGDRPKGAETEFRQVSSMPRSCWEPWGLYRKPMLELTLAENLRIWGTGGGVDVHGAREQTIAEFVYSVDAITEPADDRAPMRFREIYLQHVVPEDFRRNARGELGTRTATLHRDGLAKLRSNWIYLPA